MAYISVPGNHPHYCFCNTCRKEPVVKGEKIKRTAISVNSFLKLNPKELRRINRHG